MRLIIAGKNSIAVNVLEFAMKNLDISIFVVLNRTENFKNGFQKSLGFYANLWKIPIINIEEGYTYQDAIFLSLEFDTIIKPSFFKTKKLYNIHFSLLPAYKGMYTAALPILNGESISGITLHKIDSGIDTGDIIAQNEIKILKIYTARELYLTYIKEGTKLVVENLSNLLNGSFNSFPQQIEGASYFDKSTIDYKSLKINYRQTACQVVNQLRAFSFREYQLPKFNNVEIRSWEYTKDKSIFKPGKIVKEIKNGFKISTMDYDLLLIKDIYEQLWEYCKENDHESLKDLLKETPIDLEVKSKEGWTALMIAVYNGSYECTVKLIELGANVNACNYNYTSVLMYAKSNALKSNERRMIDFLINNGANILSKDIFGKTVLDWVKDEDIELYNYLKI